MLRQNGLVPHPLPCTAESSSLKVVIGGLLVFIGFSVKLGVILVESLLLRRHIMGVKKIALQERDLEILQFLDRVGYANVKQVAKFVGNGEKSESGVLQRLYMLRRFGYVRTETTHRGNYFFLSYKGKGNNPLIFTFKLDQLLHHDFLTELYFLSHNKAEVLSERECIAKFKIVGKKGKIPDMVIGEWIIEFERTNKSVEDCRSVVDFWTIEQGQKLCVIYENNEIRNRYSGLLNPRVRLIAKDEYANILGVLGISGLDVTNIVPVDAAQVTPVPLPAVASQPLSHPVSSSPSVPGTETGGAKSVDVIDKQYIDSVKSKYS
jgi:hypothetical protein